MLQQGEFENVGGISIPLQKHALNSSPLDIRRRLSGGPAQFPIYTQ
jgi:hypothetical protein